MMIDYQQLQGDPPRHVDARTVGADDQALFRGRPASQHLPAPRHLDQAQPADADRLQIGMVAKVRNIQVGGQGRIENGRPRAGRDLAAVDSKA